MSSIPDLHRAQAARQRPQRAAAAVLLLALLAGCAAIGPQAGPATAGQKADPFETFNRKVFDFNDAVDKAVLKPAAEGYRRYVPSLVRTGIGNVFGNINDAWSSVNNLLQGKPSDAFNDWGRVLVNTTIGIGGAFDVASEMGLDKHYEDFGQTMAVWGAGEGAYLFWPVIGPRTVRDTAGFVVDSYTDPVWYIYPVDVRNTLVGVRYIDQRAALLPTDKIIEEGATDKYAYIRDAYLQHRRNAVYDGNPPREAVLPNGKAPVELQSTPGSSRGTK